MVQRSLPDYRQRGWEGSMAKLNFSWGTGCNIKNVIKIEPLKSCRSLKVIQFQIFKWEWKSYFLLMGSWASGLFEGCDGRLMELSTRLCAVPYFYTGVSILMCRAAIACLIRLLFKETHWLIACCFHCKQSKAL